jgi:hypothetical protein
MNQANVAHLTADQIATYRRVGYIVLPSVFTPSEVRRMGEEADKILELMINSSLAVGSMNPRLALRERDDGRQLVFYVIPVGDLSEEMRQVSDDPRLVQPMREILRSEPRLMEEKIIYKQPLVEPVPLPAPPEEGVALHHDWGAFRRSGYPKETLSSAITIDDMHAGNGALRFFEGTQLKEDWPLEWNYTPLGSPNLGPALRDLGVNSLEDAVDVIAPAGSVLIFHSMVVHYSPPNPTNRPRRLLIYSHFPAWHEVDPEERHRASRQRGQEHENMYRELVAQETYRDAWHAPTY